MFKIDIASIRKSANERANAANAAKPANSAEAEGAKLAGLAALAGFSHPKTKILKQVELFSHRVQICTRRGLSQPDAEQMAQRLALRDRDLDDRKLCLECQHLSGHSRQTWACSNWKPAGFSNARDNQLAPELVLLPQRCDGYKPAPHQPVTTNATQLQQGTTP